MEVDIVIVEAIKKWRPDLLGYDTEGKKTKISQYAHFSDIPFDILNFLDDVEAPPNPSGLKTEKHLYYGKFLCAKLVYGEIRGDYNGEANVFQGTTKTAIYYKYDGSVVFKKTKPNKFNLKQSPDKNGDLKYTSTKQKEREQQKRDRVDLYLQQEHTQLYTVLFSNFKDEWEIYLQDGDGSKMVESIDAVLAISNPTSEQQDLQGFLNHQLSDDTKLEMGIPLEATLSVHHLVKQVVS